MSHEDEEYVGSVRLMFLGASLDPDKVSEALSLVPSQCWRRGEKKSYSRADGSMRVLESEYEWGGWKMRIPLEQKKEPIESQLQFWATLLKHRTAALKRFRLQGFECVLDVFVASSGTASIVLAHELQKDLTALGLDLQWSFFTSVASEQGAAADRGEDAAPAER